MLGRRVSMVSQLHVPFETKSGFGPKRSGQSLHRWASTGPALHQDLDDDGVSPCRGCGGMAENLARGRSTPVIDQFSL